MRSLKIVFLVLMFEWNSVSATARNPTDVTTSLGRVRGTQTTFGGRTVNQYLGVPFARPPLGDLRFKRTEPAEPYDGTLIADEFPPACVQVSKNPFPWYDFEDGKSEDCLYLNLWVPSDRPPDKKVPVMVWIYGGAFVVGSNRKEIYNGKVLAAKGDVVVVTINYRLGVLGFLTSGTEDAPGNYGLYDMLEALKWVNQNIAAFGGDPGQVTLAGQGPGSISIGLLCVSPLAEGLFHRVIMESGTPAYLLADNSTADNVRTSQQVAEGVGCANDTFTIDGNPGAVVECLRGKNATVLVEALLSLSPDVLRSFLPQYGDAILPRNARRELIDGNFRNVSVLIGDNRNVLSYEITTSHPDAFGFFGEKDPDVNKTYGTQLLNESFSGFVGRQEVIDHYLGDVSDADYDRIRYQVYTAIGDYRLVCPDVFFAESYSRRGNSVHFYFLTHRPCVTPWAEWMGVVAYDDVQFVFGVPLQRGGGDACGDQFLSERVVGIWTNFVKYGSTGDIRWPRYSRESPTYMKLSTKVIPSFGQGPHKANCDFFRSYFGFQ